MTTRQLSGLSSLHAHSALHSSTDPTPANLSPLDSASPDLTSSTTLHGSLGWTGVQFNTRSDLPAAMQPEEAQKEMELTQL